MDVETEAAMPDEPCPVGPCFRCGAPVLDSTRFRGRFACRRHEPEMNQTVVIPATKGSGRDLDVTPMHVTLDGLEMA